ncbi:MAG: hypothetical protein L6243_02915 [Candidatus Altiarchaeales archaeon]|nr:hypothetical protein [Candidatus Altiarchaeota archaeon]MBU4341217.1 hypothetical protein [Candidatus Altiarchaeota archaeon]MBU4436806.1 hypothetical protein [Candidatus Altiarchaeota archaeon]MCG2782518.1 hypothetical protein [Candidatus Altiarchaeales archaeon]
MIKDEPISLELNEFLGEMISMVKGRLDKQETMLVDLSSRIGQLEKKNNGSIGDLKKKVSSLEEQIKKSKLSKELLKGLER